MNDDERHDFGMGFDVDDFIAEHIAGPVAEIATNGLFCDGSHHKQWYLEQVILRLGYRLPDEGEYERGIAP